MDPFAHVWTTIAHLAKVGGKSILPWFTLFNQSMHRYVGLRTPSTLPVVPGSRTRALLLARRDQLQLEMQEEAPSRQPSASFLLRKVKPDWQLGPGRWDQNSSWNFFQKKFLFIRWDMIRLMKLT